jgi:ParB family chromosome partitioning protein
VPKSNNTAATVLSRAQELVGKKPSTAKLMLSQIVLPPNQPRKHFDPAAMASLITSFAENGQLQPILVRPKGPNTYELIAGERRYRAAKALDWPELDVVVKDLDDDEARVYPLVENLERENLSEYEQTIYTVELLAAILKVSFDEARETIMRAYNHPEKVSDSILAQINTILERARAGKLSTFASNKLRLLNLPEDILIALNQGSITSSIAVLLGRIPNSKERAELLEQSKRGEVGAAGLRNRLRQDVAPNFRRRVQTTLSFFERKSLSSEVKAKSADALERLKAAVEELEQIAAEAKSNS